MLDGALIKACRDGDLARVKYLIEEQEADVDCCADDEVSGIEREN